MKSLEPWIFVPGTLRCEISIVSKNDRDSSGGVAGSTVLLTAMAAIATQSSREAYQAAQFSDAMTHVISLRWPGNLGIVAGMQVLYGARTFDIVEPPENVGERNRKLKLICLETNSGVV